MRGRGRSKLLQIVCNRDTYPSKKASETGGRGSNAEKRHEFGTISSGFMKSDETHRVLSSNMFVSVLNFLCIPQIGRLPAHGPNVKRLLIPRSVFLSGLLRIEEIEKAFLTEISKQSVFQKKLRMGWPIVENLSELCGIFLAYLEAPN